MSRQGRESKETESKEFIKVERRNAELELKVNHLRRTNDLLESIILKKNDDLQEADETNDTLVVILENNEVEIKELKGEI